ncbi:MAG: sce7726 family protein [Spirochaetaceae bacterium]|nr:sce7726 family protein [Spirochaetaceae bacterium]
MLEKTQAEGAEYMAQITPVPRVLYDKDIRPSLFDFLDSLYETNRIIEEKEMGRSRADAVLVTFKSIYGIEIKSDQDTYARLERQIKDYDKFFYKNYVVVGTRHAAHIAEHVPEYWGIITVEVADGKEDFYLLRKPLKNPNFNIKETLCLLWKSELTHILARNNFPLYKEKSKEYVRKRLLAYIPAEKLLKEVCIELMERDYTLIKPATRSTRSATKRPRRK